MGMGVPQTAPLPPGAALLGDKANTHVEGVQQGLGGHFGPVGKSMWEFGADVVAVTLEEAVQQTFLPEDLSQLLPPFQGQPGTSPEEKQRVRENFAACSSCKQHSTPSTFVLTQRRKLSGLPQNTASRGFLQDPKAPPESRPSVGHPHLLRALSQPSRPLPKAVKRLWVLVFPLGRPASDSLAAVTYLVTPWERAEAAQRSTRRTRMVPGTAGGKRPVVYIAPAHPHLRCQERTGPPLPHPPPPPGRHPAKAGDTQGQKDTANIG